MSHIEQTVEVAVPVRTAYNQWTQFEEFPRFMAPLSIAFNEEISDTAVENDRKTIELDVTARDIGTQTTLVFESTAEAAIRQMNVWGGKPLPLSATCHHDGKLFVRLSGAAPAVEAAVRTLGGSALADDVNFWRALASPGSSKYITLTMRR